MSARYVPRIVEEELDELLGLFEAVLIEGPSWCGKTTTAGTRAASSCSSPTPRGTSRTVCGPSPTRRSPSPARRRASSTSGRRCRSSGTPRGSSVQQGRRARPVHIHRLGDAARRGAAHAQRGRALREDAHGHHDALRRRVERRGPPVGHRLWRARPGARSAPWTRRPSPSASCAVGGPPPSGATHAPPRPWHGATSTWSRRRTLPALTGCAATRTRSGPSSPRSHATSRRSRPSRRSWPTWAARSPARPPRHTYHSLPV